MARPVPATSGTGRLQGTPEAAGSIHGSPESPAPNLAAAIQQAPSRHSQIYAITDLTPDTASPGELADALRAHWGIENRLHWIRDVTFAEDLSQIRAGHGPAVMAALRNLAISLHRRASAANIAAACRHISRHPGRVLPLLL